MMTTTGGLPVGSGTVARPAPLRLLPVAGRACCCPAKAAYQVLMAPTADRPPVELLLCGHHFRASAQKLRATGARVFDAEGHFLAWD